MILTNRANIILELFSITCGDDLALGEEEAILPAVPQLYQVRVLDPRHALRPVRRTARKRV